MGEAGGHIYYNAWAGNKMNELENYKLETYDQGYHIYVAIWEAAVGQVLLCQQAREWGNIDDPYAVTVVENNNTLIDNDAPALNNKFRG